MIIGQQCGGERSRRGVATRKAAGGRRAHGVGMVFARYGSRTAEESLDALIDDERFGAQTQRKSHRLLAGAYAEEDEANVEDMPDNAEVTDLRRGVKHSVGNGISSNAVERVVEELIGAIERKIHRRLLGGGQSFGQRCRGLKRSQLGVTTERGTPSLEGAIVTERTLAGLEVAG
jgi:hypothetical protein